MTRGRSTLSSRATGSCALGFLDDIELICDLLALLGDSRRLTVRLVWNLDCARHLGVLVARAHTYETGRDRGKILFSVD